MSLKCVRGEEQIFAYNVHSDEAWELLRRENAKEKQLRMPCCNSSVVLRSSKLGTRHFAHAPRAQCLTAPETAEHLLAKAIIVEAVRRTAWDPLAEQSGTSPSGEEWRADVLAEHGQAKVAFEIQWSRQGHEETRRRQSLYAASGIRGLWFFRQHDFPVDLNVPAFRLDFDAERRRFTVLLPSPHYSSQWASNRMKEAFYWQQSIDLADFVQGALERRLHFAPALGRRLPLEVSAAVTECWKCRRSTKIVTGLNFAAGKVLHGCPDIPISIYDFAEQLPDGDRLLMGLLPSGTLAKHGIGAIKPRFSKTENQAYISNGCIHCDVLQGRFFDHEVAYEGKVAFEIETVLEAGWGPLLESATEEIYRWWFDQREDPRGGAASTPTNLP